MGNSLRILDEKTALIATTECWIEGRALQQLQTTAKLEGMRQVVGMPDLHPGRGYPIGVVCWSNENTLYPALVGNDIGCGVALFSTDAIVHRLKLTKLEKQLSQLPGLDETDYASLLQQSEIPDLPVNDSLGTVGGGNHFAELQQVVEVYENTASMTMAKDQLYCLIHSGSRGLGQQILASHIREYGHKPLSNQQVQQAYMAQHHLALAWAKLNRTLIALRIQKAIKCQMHCLLDVAHNLVAPVSINGESGWLHRKGAVPADLGPVVIPGSRGDYSYLVQPHANWISLNSLAHGAGRKWQRSECYGRLKKRYTVRALQQTKIGGRVICDDRELLFEEAPEAYKDINHVIEVMERSGLLTKIAKLKPVITYKKPYD
ncbi:RNA ligase RtcB family protein [Zooshikella ganghwensis]|uniref:RNA ligase RtcB family protein n=1 Tax=Zooshikella ganghwensis TaxID=202772 RepID=UPI0003FF15E2|nr:RNA ligase RtcB family protein [Zooshikella ganghwensis]